MTRLAIVRQRYNPAGGARRFVNRAGRPGSSGSLDIDPDHPPLEDHAGYHT